MTQRTRTPGEAVTRPDATPPAADVEGYYWVRARRGAAPWIVGAVGLAAIGAVQLFPVRHTMEGDLQDRSLAALRSAGLNRATVDFTGRDGTVHGVTAADRDRAVQAVRSLEGVRVVAADEGAAAGTAAPAQAAAVKAVLSGGALTLTGTVGTEAAHQALVSAAGQTLGQDRVTDDLTVDAARSDAGVDRLGGLLAVLTRAPGDVTVELSGGRVTLTGTVPDAATRDAAVKAAVAVAGDPSRVVDHLTAATGTAPTGSPSASPSPSVSPSPSPSPSASPSPSPSPGGGQAGDGTAEATGQALAGLPQVTFRTDSATLTPAGQQVVARAAAILKAAPAVKVRVEGCTDDLGDWDVNKALSTARAQAVREALVAAGVDGGRLTTFGWSEDHPALPNTSAANRAANRRVVFAVQR